MQDLRKTRQSSEKLSKFCGPKGNISPQVKMDEDRALHAAKLSKMEAEMKNVFQQKVHEKEGKLKQSEEELYARHSEMKESLEKQRAELEERKAKIDLNKSETKRKGLGFSR